MQAVILAAGASSRFWPLNTRHKSLLQVRGQSLLEHMLDGLVAQNVTEVVIVQGPDRDVEQTITAPDAMNVTFVVQESADGMGDAVRQAAEHVSEQFIVTGPYRVGIDGLLEEMLPRGEDYDGAVAGTETDHPERYGMLALDDSEDQATGIVEKPESGEAPSQYKVVSTYILSPEFFEYLNAVEQHEYDFEDALDRYMTEQDVRFIPLAESLPSLKYPWDVFEFVETLLEDQEPQVAESADVANSATVDGNVVIAEGTKVYENAVIRGPCYIGENCTIGNNAVVRSYTNIESESTVGANMEIRGSVVQKGFSCHSGFIGDSIIDRDVSLGAGVITANRMVRDADGIRPPVSVYVRAKDQMVDTGRHRLGMIVGEQADIGTNANIMPGTCIGKRTFIGPSTFLKHNIGDQKKYFTKVEGRELERR